MTWNSDRELLTLMRTKLNSCVVGDVLDVLGHRNQFLPPAIRPLQDHLILAGRAMTVLEADCCGTTLGHNGEEHAFGRMFEALDSLKEDEVYICTGSSPEYAQWGELMSQRARRLKAAGAVMNGYSRDTRAVREMDYPVFSFGPYGQDQGVRGRVVDYRCPIRFPNGVVVNPGDLLMGDVDGVVVVPQQIEREVIEAALEKVSGENRVRDAILKGMSTVEAFETFGIM